MTSVRIADHTPGTAMHIRAIDDGKCCRLCSMSAPKPVLAGDRKLLNEYAQGGGALRNRRSDTG